MGSTRPTTAKNLQKAIKNHLVTVVNAQTECKDTNEVQTITTEQFITDLNFYMESGIFSDSLDFKYRITGKEFLQVEVGYMSSFCQCSIEVTLRLCDGVTLDEATKQFTDTLFVLIPPAKRE